MCVCVCVCVVCVSVCVCVWMRGKEREGEGEREGDKSVCNRCDCAPLYSYIFMQSLRETFDKLFFLSRPPSPFMFLQSAWSFQG